MNKNLVIVLLLVLTGGLGTLLVSGGFFNTDELENTEPAHAEVLKIKGEVRKISSLGGRVSPLLPGNALFMSDSVQTGADSAATILFADESKILVSENSRVSMVRLLKEKETGEIDTLIEVSAGNVESRVTKKKSFGAKYEVRTPSMHMAVRGTVFTVNVQESTGKTSSSVLEGMVVASASGKIVELPAGKGTIAEVGLFPAEAMVLLEPPVLTPLPAMNERMPLHFAWQSVPEAMSYRLQLFTGKSGDFLMYDQVHSTSKVDISTLPDADYVMRVSGIADGGLEGLNSEQRFSLNARPWPPVASWPIGADSSSQEKVKFRWASSAVATSYLFQVSDKEDFSTIVAEVNNLPGKMKGISVKLAPGHYFWRVASLTIKEGQGPFSDTYAFSVVDQK